jgi:hypothetical protein
MPETTCFLHWNPHSLIFPWEREFLKLAGVWLACRWTVLGGQIPGCVEARGPLELQILGMVDHAWELRLLIEELTCKPIST